jgi:dipeptidase
VTQLRAWLPDEVGGVCWLSLDNPGQSPRVPVFSGTTQLPKAYETCGQKQYVEDCALWRFRRANKLATVAWQATKEGFNKEIDRLESLALDGMPTSAESLDQYTDSIYQECIRSWKALEEKYWLQFGMGF